VSKEWKEANRRKTAFAQRTEEGKAEELKKN